MPYVVFIAAPPVELQRNMYEYARLKGKMHKIRTVCGIDVIVVSMWHRRD